MTSGQNFSTPIHLKYILDASPIFHYNPGLLLPLHHTSKSHTPLLIKRPLLTTTSDLNPPTKPFPSLPTNPSRNHHNGYPILLPPQLQHAQVRVHAHPMGLLNVPLRPSLVHLRMQILQAEDMPSMHLQSLVHLDLSLQKNVFLACSFGMNVISVS